MITARQLELFQDKGFLIVRDFLSEKIATYLRTIAGQDEAIADHAYQQMDADGRPSKVTLWYYPGNDVFGRLSCSERMIGEMSTLLGGQACFFHAKLMQKEAETGGAWEWHQDYGYWYDDGFPQDVLGSCYVALDEATKANGCLQVIPGSHQMGHLPHQSAGEQRGADPVRVAVLRDRLGIEDCELAPGDALYFHANLLHASGPNLSHQARWGLISCFFRHDNVSMKEDPRFQKKDTPIIPHDDILRGDPPTSIDKGFLKL